MINRERITLSRNGLIAFRFVYTPLALLLTIAIFVTLIQIGLNFSSFFDRPLWPDVALTLFSLLLFSWIDYGIVKSLLSSMTIFINESGIYYEENEVPWRNVDGYKITSGQFPDLEISIQVNGKKKTINGKLSLFPSKARIDHIKGILNSGLENRKPKGSETNE